MSAQTEERRKAIIAGSVGALALGAVLYEVFALFGGPSTPPARTTPPVTAPAVRGGIVPADPVATGAVANTGPIKVASSIGQLDPSLHMEGMLEAESVLYTGTGRNIFAQGAEPVKQVAILKTNYPVRPLPPTPTTNVTYTAPQIPPINLKFFGTATQNGIRRALLLGGDDVFLATAGDVVQRRYKIVSIAANSIAVEDLANNNQQNLPLLSVQ